MDSVHLEITERFSNALQKWRSIATLSQKTNFSEKKKCWVTGKNLIMSAVRIRISSKI